MTLLPLFDKYNNLDALTLKGFFHAHMYDKENAFRCFDELFKIVPDDVGVCYNKGIAYRILNENELALCCFDKFLAENPGHIDSLGYKGLCYLYLGEYDKALDYFDRVLEKENSAINLLRKSLCYSMLKMHDEAIKSIEIIFYVAKMSVQTKIVVAKYGLHPYSMHPAWATALRRAMRILWSGSIPWRSSQIHSEKGGRYDI